MNLSNHSKTSPSFGMKSEKILKDHKPGNQQKLESLNNISRLLFLIDLEDLTDGAENSNLMHILDKDLERVIAEATKLQSQVLESIIGNKADTGVREESQVTANETSELMTDAEKQIRIHRSEKETFSKGIASIIYEPEKGENAPVKRRILRRRKLKFEKIMTNEFKVKIYKL